jgi:hypothetical protein
MLPLKWSLLGVGWVLNDWSAPRCLFIKGSFKVSVLLLMPALWGRLFILAVANPVSFNPHYVFICSNNSHLNHGCLLNLLPLMRRVPSFFPF